MGYIRENVVIYCVYIVTAHIGWAIIVKNKFSAQTFNALTDRENCIGLKYRFFSGKSKIYLDCRHFRPPHAVLKHNTDYSSALFQSYFSVQFWLSLQSNLTGSAFVIGIRLTWKYASRVYQMKSQVVPSPGKLYCEILTFRLHLEPLSKSLQRVVVAASNAHVLWFS